MLQAVIDRFEGNRAVLLLGEAEKAVVFPRRYLPPELKEGDYLQLTIAYDEAATQRARAASAVLLAEISRGEA